MRIKDISAYKSMIMRVNGEKWRSLKIRKLFYDNSRKRNINLAWNKTEGEEEKADKMNI